MTTLVHQQYQAANVTLASPTALIGLLYGELLCCLTRAREAVLKKDLKGKRKNTAKAIQILTLLMTSLNMEKGADVALNLAMLYEHVSKRLLQANQDTTTAPFDEAIRLLAPLKEAWDAISASPREAAPATSYRLASVVA